jgi:hypothetical protein
VREAFQQFVAEPGPEQFEAVRSRLLAMPGFDPYSSERAGLEELLAAERFEDAQALIARAMPCWLLSPWMHVTACAVFRALGREDEARLEALVAGRCLDALMASGTGTAEAPYRVLRPDDVTDVLRFLELEPGEQHLEQRGAHTYEVHATAQREVWFDVSDAVARRTQG